MYIYFVQSGFKADNFFPNKQLAVNGIYKTTKTKFILPNSIQLFEYTSLAQCYYYYYYFLFQFRDYESEMYRIRRTALSGHKLI